MKLKLLLLALCSVLTAQAQVPTPTYTVTHPTCSDLFGIIQVTSPLNNSSAGPASNLFISEVTDQTSGALSYIELYNGTGNTVNLANYKLLVYSNGMTTATCNLVLSGTMANNTVKVISMGSATNQGGITPDLSFAGCGGVNNNDNISLVSSTNVLIDTWGRSDGVAFTPTSAGYVYRRNPESVHPSTIWNPGDWTATAPENYSNIGTYVSDSYYLYSLNNVNWQSSPTFIGVTFGQFALRVKEMPSGNVSDPEQVDVWSPMPNANFSYASDSFCASQAFEEMPIMSPGTTMGGTFSAPSGLTINPNTGAINPSQSLPGPYVVMYSISANMNCSAVNGNCFIEILAAPLANITADNTATSNIAINNGSAVQLGINTQGSIASVEWTPALAISSATIPNPIVYPNTNTNYTAEIIYSNGCPASASINVDVNLQPSAGVVGLTTTNNSIGLFDTVTLNVELAGVVELYSLFMKLKGNTAVNQYLDFEGYSVGTLLGTGSAITAPVPTVSGNSVDFGISKVGAVSGSNGGGLFYTLIFKPKNVSIPNGTSFCFYLDDVNAVNESATAFGLTNQGEVCVTYNSQVDVWPGDLDKSNSVTTADLLPIGYFYNATGPARSNASLNWTAQQANLWGYNHNISNDDGYKVFADANGDGVVNSTDQLAIDANINQSHSKMGGTSVAPPNVANGNSVGAILVTTSTNVIEGAGVPQPITFTVSVDNTVGLDALYGINTNLLFDSDFFDLSTATVDYTGSIFGTVNSDCLVQKFASESYLSVALTRYANAPINGDGLLFKVTLLTKPMAQGLGYNTTVFGYSDAANDQAGAPLPVNDAYPTNINISNLGMPTNVTSDFVFYPNPVKDNLTVKSSSVINLVTVYNVMGQLVWRKSQDSNEITMDLSDLPRNTYFVKVTSDSSQEAFKIIKE